MKPYYQHNGITIYHADAIEAMRRLNADSIDLIAVDPPYYRVKSEPWDRQWDTADDFLAWIGQLCKEWQRVLKPNGSLYVFASPQMAARVECEIANYFNIVNSITWEKPDFSTKAEMFDKSTMRGFFPSSERIIFAEHKASDELLRFVFEPVRIYLDNERKAADLRIGDMNVICGTTFNQRNTNTCPIQWCMITEDRYRSLQEARPGFFTRPYTDLRAEYEKLHRDYEDLRRPFNATPDAPYTDVWNFKTVQDYPGKHPTEKPLALMEHIVKMSSRPDALVLDCCMGSGTTLVAARNLGRRAIGVDLHEPYCRRAVGRLRQETFLVELEVDR